MNDSTQKLRGKAVDDSTSGKGTKNFPLVGTVLRPSRDEIYSKKFLVTELRTGQEGGTIISTSLKPFTSSVSVPPQRIRGGGDDTEMKDAQAFDGNTSIKLDF